MAFVDFPRDVYEAVCMIKDREEQEAVITELLRWAFDGIEGKRVSGFSNIAKAVYFAARPSMAIKGIPKSSGSRKKLSDKHRMMILERDNFTCQYCGRSAPDVILEIDHIVPVAKGGTNKPENLVTACKECNRGKRAHIIGEKRKW